MEWRNVLKRVGFSFGMYQKYEIFFMVSSLFTL